MSYSMFMKKVQFQFLVWKEGKHFVAQCLNIDISSFGKTKKVALDNLEEALELYFQDEKHPSFQKIEHPELVETTLGV